MRENLLSIIFNKLLSFSFIFVTKINNFFRNVNKKVW